MNRIKEIKEKYNLTFRQIAERLGITIRQVQNYAASDDIPVSMQKLIDYEFFSPPVSPHEDLTRRIADLEREKLRLFEIIEKCMDSRGKEKPPEKYDDGDTAHKKVS